MSPYRDFLSPKLTERLLRDARPVAGVEGLSQLGTNGGWESPAALKFLAELSREVRAELAQVLEQRRVDRDFIDRRTQALGRLNRELGLGVTDVDYRTVLGLEDQHGRIVVGPRRADYGKSSAKDRPVAALPEWLRGPHVTLFGPPDSAKMCVNAMNAYHRQLKGEPAIVRELLATHTSLPKWGADDEDSKTPLRADLVSAGENLTRCFEGTISVQEGEKRYELQADHLSLPIKRFPGLALPCPFLFLDGEPLPLHLYDFALHLFRNWPNERALVFYVPKLENEEEARYVRRMIESAERLVQKRHPEYRAGSVRLMIVLENPRAVFRTNEIIDELHPYFAGASLGWHDFLASTARLYREDPNYRIPIKADPDIVIKYIKASHELLARVVEPRGGIKIGGMYGILPLTNDLRSESFQVTIKGYIRDVVTQMKRDLDGFWVAHPDFVRLGLALVEAWRLHRQGDSQKLRMLIDELLEPAHRQEIHDFVFGPDIEGLDPAHPRYARSLIVADLEASRITPNHSPEEIRYNVFQSLQYLADWLGGNGCVALPTQVGGVAVRVMDDLATAERSRWEVWHEIRHGRVKAEDFLRIAHEEMRFIRKDLSDGKKIVQVKWDERTARWYPLAFKLMVQLMTDPNPVEFATELLLPFTLDAIREAADPWALLEELAPRKYRIPARIARFNHAFECCGHRTWAAEMATRRLSDLRHAEELIRGFELQDINEAAAFHGDIGEAPRTLDARAAGEQARVIAADEAVRRELLELGQAYRRKYGMKFLAAAQGKGADELLTLLKQRSQNPLPVELENAREALWQITRQRLGAETPSLAQKLDELRTRFRVKGAQIALTEALNAPVEQIALGEARTGQAVREHTFFEIASLSKPLASAFAIEFFRAREIPLDTPVNALFRRAGAAFQLRSAEGLPAEWAERVTVRELLNHSALNLHYVNGVPANEAMPPVREFLDGHARYGYEPVRVISEPGSAFRYSGAGFLVLEHLIESLAGQPAAGLAQTFLDSLRMRELRMDPEPQTDREEAHGFRSDGSHVEGTRKMFPSFAAGALGTARGMQEFLAQLTDAFGHADRREPLSHDTAVEMLHGHDLGSVDFMGAKMGLGIFVIDAGTNRLALHQGANDGFRALCLHTFEGPSVGRGFTIFANGELEAVQFIAEAAKLLLRELEVEGVRFDQFRESFDSSRLRPEEIVNRGYKELVFAAFEPRLPDPIPRRGARDPLSRYDRAAGSEVLSSSNQIFARGENLVDPHFPVFEADLYCDQGKVMDSWESARHNPRPFHDLVLKLPRPAELKYALFSTAYHLGNQVPAASLDASESESGEDWTEILPRLPLEGHATKRVLIERGLGRKFVRVRVKVYPDGGLSRLQLFDEELPATERASFLPADRATSVIWPDPIPQTHKPLSVPFASDPAAARARLDRLPAGQEFNNASASFGASIVSCSNQHYGPVTQVISPIDPLHMFDGFESARSRTPGHTEEVVIRLASARPVERIELDFTYYVNNNPRAVRIEGLGAEAQWLELAPLTEVKGFAANRKVFYPKDARPVSQLRVTIYPDGGINRLRAYSRK